MPVEAGARQRPQGNEGLDPSDVALALENVGELFGGAATSGETGGAESYVNRKGSATMFQGRNRVDSQARPYEFFAPPKLTKKDQKDTDDYQNFSIHGQPQTPSPKPSAPNPQPQSSTLNPTPSTRHQRTRAPCAPREQGDRSEGDRQSEK